MPEVKYRYIGDYAREIENQTLAPGDFVDLDKSKCSDLTKELITDAILLEVKPPEKAGGSVGSSATTGTTSSGGGE